MARGELPLKLSCFTSYRLPCSSPPAPARRSGHGGHLSHMTAWFAGSSTLCPTGCMHTCHLEVGGAGGAGSTER